MSWSRPAIWHSLSWKYSRQAEMSRAKWLGEGNSSFRWDRQPALRQTLHALSRCTQVSQTSSRRRPSSPASGRCRPNLFDWLSLECSRCMPVNRKCQVRANCRVGKGKPYGMGNLWNHKLRTWRHLAAAARSADPTACIGSVVCAATARWRPSDGSEFRSFPWGAFDSAKNHKRQRRKRQSVTAKREKSQTPKFV